MVGGQNDREVCIVVLASVPLGTTLSGHVYRVMLTESLRGQNPFVEQDNGRAHSNPDTAIVASATRTHGRLIALSRPWADEYCSSPHVEGRVDGALGRLSLCGLGINGGKDISGGVARRPALFFDAHVVASCRCDRESKGYRCDSKYCESGITYRTRRLKGSIANSVAKSQETSMGYAEVEGTNERMVKLEQKPEPKDGGGELQRPAVQVMQSRQVKVCAKTMQRKRYQEPRVFAVLGKNPLSDLGGRIAVDFVISRSRGRKLRALGRRDDNRQKGRCP